MSSESLIGSSSVLVAGLVQNLDQGKVTADAADPAYFRAVIEICLRGEPAT
jgi:hypothetical protein